MLSLVMGGAGFLGSHLVDALASQGDEVIIADSLLAGSLANVEDALCGRLATFVYLDVARPVVELRAAILRAARFRRIARIFCVAAPSTRGGANVSEMLDRSAAMPLIELAIEHHARFIYASASDFYSSPLPNPESDPNFAIAGPSEPCDCNEANHSTEVAISVAVSRHGLDARILRFINCYGPRMTQSDDRLLPALAGAISADMPMQICGDGLQRRSMTFVDDAVRFLVDAAKHPQPLLVPFNIGSDEELSVLEIAEAFARVAGAPFLVEHVGSHGGEPCMCRPDFSRARFAGYIPRTTLAEGLSKTIAWVRNSTGVYV